ncbi:E3 ubiquitin-protein ligase RING1-like [Acorus calamus]|uniref:RING-type E3 ubiquitin transferase n=1 Tax=Acorus calamus TaxID=4465 RepID=A0AAV9D6G1_ACOCL|nr:E3 ubiquitin-protein ligase RING1-like [Acorus calamus]
MIGIAIVYRLLKKKKTITNPPSIYSLTNNARTKHSNDAAAHHPQQQPTLLDVTAAEEWRKKGSPPASMEAVEALKEVEVVEDEAECAVCKEGMGLGMRGRGMPCGHVYHTGCIAVWLGSRNSCPLCRFELPTDDPVYEARRAERAGYGARGGAR